MLGRDYTILHPATHLSRTGQLPAPLCETWLATTHSTNAYVKKCAVCGFKEKRMEKDNCPTVKSATGSFGRKNKQEYKDTVA